jgi:hypothetical protein
VAAATAVAVAVSGISATPRTPGGGNTARPLTISPENALLVAATNAAKAPSTGAFWHTRTISGNQRLVPGGYLVEQRYLAEEWFPSQAGKPSYSVRRYLGATPVTDADKAAWRAAGSPTHWQLSASIPSPSGKKGVLSKTSTIDAAPGPEQALKDDVDTGLGMLANQRVTQQMLATLPADPQGLRRYFEPRLDRLWTGISPAARPTMDQQLFEVALSIIVHMPVPPKVRSAAYRLIATLPSVIYHPSLKDALGRTATAVGVPMSDSGGSRSEERLVFDPATGRPLDSEFVITQADSTTRLGQYVGFGAIQEPGWVSALPNRTFVPVKGVG